MGQEIAAASCCADADSISNSAAACCVEPAPAPVESSLGGFFGNLLNTSSYPPRWECGNWSQLEGWLHIVSDLMIFAAYFAIPVALVYFILRRRDFPFHSIFFLFGAFILLCGMTHAVEAIIFYFPIYRIQGLLKLVTGVVSIGTFLVLLRLMPTLMELPGLATINAKLREADAAKSNFLANMSHEIRTPMTAILGYADVLLDDPNDEEREIASQIIKRNGEHLLAIVNDILDLSKIEAGKLTVEKSAVSPRELLDGTLDLMQVKADAKGLMLKATYDEPLPASLTTDATRMRQVLLNIIGNAIKFTEVGEVNVLVTHRLEENLLAFVIRDTGIGMTPEQLERIGKPFSQADETINRSFGGTGLGLAICVRLVELMGGRIQIESQLGVGTVVHVLMPLQDEPFKNSKTNAIPVEIVGLSSAAPADLPLNGLWLLLAEDGPDNQRLISFLLKRAGAQVDIVEDGAQALVQAWTNHSAIEERKNRYDVILMDMQMPIMDGYEATKQLRQQGYTFPILAVTAHAMAEDEKKCLDAGCNGYISKPIDRRRLIELVREWATKDASLAARGSA